MILEQYRQITLNYFDLLGGIGGVGKLDSLHNVQNVLGVIVQSGFHLLVSSIIILLLHLDIYNYIDV